jgi:peroxiredoxin
VVTIVLLDQDGDPHVVAGTPHAVDASDLAKATGWSVKPQGWCRGDICVPLPDTARAPSAGEVDLDRWAAALGYRVAVDDSHGVVALMPSARSSSAAVAGEPAPDLSAADIDGVTRSLADLAGRKRVLVAWASWCGCRHELGSWDALQRELEPAGLSVFSVALENRVDDARPWIEAAAPAYPVVVDTAHVAAARFGITNVPSTVWIDERGVIVKPATISPGDDQFRDFTKVDSATHHDALRRWVVDGERPDVSGLDTGTRTDDEWQALAERRLATWLHNNGHPAAAAAHLERAAELAPWDWTIRRAGIALRGGDPFLGEEFLAFWTEWDEAGRPGYRPMG